MNHPTISTAVTGLAIPILAALLAAAPARATPLGYSNGLVSPAVVIDFNGLSDGIDIGATYAGQGVTFGGLYVSSVLGSSLPPSVAPAAANFLGQTTNATFTISFSAAVSDAAFFLDTDGFGTTITSSLGGTNQESVTAGNYSNVSGNFFGFTNSSFDLITVVVSGTGTAVIDNLQIGAAIDVPEPGSAIMVVGLAGLLAFGGRRRGVTG